MSWTILIFSLTVLACGLCVAATALRLPGTWSMVAGAALLGWWREWSEFGWRTVAVLALVALAAEGIEMLVSLMTARRAGASSRAAWGGLIGGFVGMMFLSFTPIPLVSSILGALAGCFLGAVIGELTAQSRWDKSAKVGFAAAIGFALGSAAKTSLALVMAAVVVVQAWPMVRSAP